MRLILLCTALCFVPACKQQAGFSGSSGVSAAEPATVAANNDDEDPFERRLKRQNGQSGQIQATLVWDSVDDLDLWAIGPTGEVIYFREPKDSAGAFLDVDMNADTAYSNSPVENVFWSKAAAEDGRYRFYVNYYTSRSGDKTVPFKLRVKANGKQKVISGTAHFHELEGGEWTDNVSSIVPRSAKLIHELNYSKY